MKSAFRIAFTASLYAMAATGIDVEAILRRRSSAPQPYPYVNGGRVDPAAAGEWSVDPLAAYVWDAPERNAKLQVYVSQPKSAEALVNSGSFKGLETISTDKCNVHVTGPGMLRIDFGVELPAWLEIDSPDLSGNIMCGIYEYAAPPHMRRWGAKGLRPPRKVAAHTYRLVLNRELYDGLRFAIIDVRRFKRPFTITGIRAMTQVMPVNYTGRFECDNPMLNRV